MNMNMNIADTIIDMIKMSIIYGQSPTSLWETNTTNITETSLMQPQSLTRTWSIIYNTTVIVIISYIMKNNYLNKYGYSIYYTIYNNIKYTCFGFWSYKSIILEGKQCLKATDYVSRTDNLFSTRFLAFWNFIATMNVDNPDINCLKEFASSSNIYDDHGDSKKSRRSIRSFNNTDTGCDTENADIYILNQYQSIKIAQNIYCRVETSKEIIDDKKHNTIENIKIEIYSYVLSMKELCQFITNIENEYERKIYNIRFNKKYIYTLNSSKDINNDSYNAWDECEFISCRKFNNLFFEQKPDLLRKLEFFENNREWYDYEGHPYTFGIGLYGPPGTGKTSIIKSIANHLKRHIIVIPLQKITTQTEFTNHFFEQIYNRNNINKIGFKDKIIVFEDIDCMSDIVKQRNIENPDKTDTPYKTDTHDSLLAAASISNNQTVLLNKIAKKLDDDHKVDWCPIIPPIINDKITLSFILNIIDGIRETPGRIMIITSNDYNSLDKALVRPGRIDMTLEMKNASKQIICEMYNHYYHEDIPCELIDTVPDYKYSPAEIVNMRLLYDKDEFLKKICEI